MGAPVSPARGIRAAQWGLLVNAVLAMVKLMAGLLGNSYALVADAVESTADIFSSLIVWGGLRIASREPDDEYPFGYGKAESLAAVIVSLMLLGAAGGIAIQAVREIRLPHHTPASFTLAVLILVVAAKEVLFRRVAAVARDVGSTAVKADAWHHRSDAITSIAAFIGIAVALVAGPGWESSDDWAALFASAIIAFNGVGLLRPALQDLMDRAPQRELRDRIAAIAAAVPAVRIVEKLNVRKSGLGYFVDLHVQTDPAMPLRDAHVLSGRVKSAIRDAAPGIINVLVHMEPYESTPGP
jgi:cation diffusion facilitator family transporter